MRDLLRGLTPHALLPLLLAVPAGAAAQDFPLDIPGMTRDPRTQPPVGLLLPEEPAPALVTPLAILDRLVVPGTRLQLEWRPRGGISTAEIASPVIVARGAMAGPVLCLTAGVHGDEINGVEIVRRLSHSVDPARLSGTVIGVPIVNVFGYSRGSRYLPDRRDLNRSFPGSRQGSIASRIAHGFFQDIVRHCDVLVDFHTGSFDRANLPQVRADLTNPDVLEFTRGFGATVVLHSPGNKGMLRVAATAVGIPAVTFEAGAPTRLEPAEIAQAVAAIERLMVQLEMREDPEAGPGAAGRRRRRGAGSARAAADLPGLALGARQLRRPADQRSVAGPARAGRAEAGPGDRPGQQRRALTSWRRCPAASSACRRTRPCCPATPPSTWAPRPANSRRCAKRPSRMRPTPSPRIPRSAPRRRRSRTARTSSSPRRRRRQKATRTPTARLRPGSGAKSLR